MKYVVVLNNGKKYAYEASSPQEAMSAFGGQAKMATPMDSSSVALAPPQEAARDTSLDPQEESAWEGGLAQFGGSLAGYGLGSMADKALGTAVNIGKQGGRLAKFGLQMNPIGLTLGAAVPAGMTEAGAWSKDQPPDVMRALRGTGAGLATGAIGGVAAPVALAGGRAALLNVGSKLAGLPKGALARFSTTEGRQAIRGAEGQEQNISAKVRSAFDKQNFPETFPEAEQVNQGLAKFSAGGESPAPLAISTKGALDALKYVPETPAGTSALPSEISAQSELAQLQKGVGRETSSGNIVPTNMSPQAAWETRKRIGAETDWAPEFGRTPITEQRMRAAYGALRGEVRTFLEQRGEKETIAAMDKLAEKLATKERAGKAIGGKDLDQFQANLEKVIGTIARDNSINRQQKIRALKDIEDQFGISILGPAENISQGRELGLFNGQLPMMSRSTTGLAGSAMGGLTAAVPLAMTGNIPAAIAAGTVPFTVASPRVLSDMLYATQPGSFVSRFAAPTGFAAGVQGKKLGPGY